jgi:DNA-binding MarR family transcriptional regulator
MRTEHIIALVAQVRERANRLITAELERRGHPGLAPSHGAILSRLYESGPQPMSVLAQAIDRRKNTLTTLVNKLEAAGYVTRQTSPDDSRVALIALTTKGEDFRGDFRAISDLLLKKVWGDMDEAEKIRLVHSLKTILGNLS